MPGGWELALVAAVIMLLFGFKRLPSAARDLGRSMRILREEVGHDDAPNLPGDGGRSRPGDSELPPS